MYIIFLHPMHYPRTTLALPLSSSSDPGSHGGPSSPLPTTVRAFIFYREKISALSSLATRVEVYIPTLLGALST